jgi:hypothetical protein
MDSAFRRCSPLRRVAAVLVALTVVSGVTVAAGAPAGAAGRPAPRLKDPAVTGRALATEFLTILQAGDRAALAKFLDPAFLLQRTDGTGADKQQYLADPATITSFEIDDALVARQDDDVLTVRWGVAVNSTIDGVAQRIGVAPRLSTFRWRNGRWRLLSHANFNMPS